MLTCQIPSGLWPAGDSSRAWPWSRFDPGRSCPHSEREQHQNPSITDAAQNPLKILKLKWKFEPIVENQSLHVAGLGMPSFPKNYCIQIWHSVGVTWCYGTIKRKDITKIKGYNDGYPATRLPQSNRSSFARQAPTVLGRRSCETMASGTPGLAEETLQLSLSERVVVRVASKDKSFFIPKSFAKVWWDVMMYSIFARHRKASTARLDLRWRPNLRTNLRLSHQRPLLDNHPKVLSVFQSRFQSRRSPKPERSVPTSQAPKWAFIVEVGKLLAQLFSAHGSNRQLCHGHSRFFFWGGYGHASHNGNPEIGCV